MDWEMIIERNRERILLALAPLLAVLGFDPRRRCELPRRRYRELLLLLRPAESAVRRLIVIAARGIVVKLSAVRAFPKFLFLKKGKEKNDEEEHFPAFCLVDPFKRFAPLDFGWAKEWSKGWGKVPVIPRISVPGLTTPFFPEPRHIPSDADFISTDAMLRRLRSLREALNNLPRHALRLARWRARQEQARKAGIRRRDCRLSPMRPGRAPGHRRNDPREIDTILRDCHYFADEAWRCKPPDTS
jgi:hypothetical protein